MADKLYQIAHDSWCEEHQVVTKIRGQPEPLAEVQRDVAYLGGDWYVREVNEGTGEGSRETD